MHTKCWLRNTRSVGCRAISKGGGDRNTALRLEDFKIRESLYMPQQHKKEDVPQLWLTRKIPHNSKHVLTRMIGCMLRVVENCCFFMFRIYYDGVPLFSIALNTLTSLDEEHIVTFFRNNLYLCDRISSTWPQITLPLKTCFSGCGRVGHDHPCL